ncbi:MAG: aminotransferase class III-fold pyridoxal phosphate-dependent enzyme, partial [Paraglaciecola sp.]|nr:aminotransferase class III-fold pyridoxal phosphate-dependent enzyme [Paraglaciecola sp.]
GGAQQKYAITPDLTCVGKVIGGGMPVGAFGGKREIMERLAPVGPVYQAGTLSGNPVAMAAGLAALPAIQQNGLYEQLTENTKMLAEGFKSMAHKHGIPMTVNYAGSMFGLFFTDVERVTNYQQAINCNTKQFNQFYHGMLENGVYLAPASYEAGFVSAAHTADIIEQTLLIADKVLAEVAATK